MFQRDGQTYAEDYEGEHLFTEGRIAELKEHLVRCEIPFLTCSTCFELFKDIGYTEYATLIEPFTEEDTRNI